VLEDWLPFCEFWVGKGDSLPAGLCDEDDDDPGLAVELVWPVGPLDPLSPPDDVDGEPPLEPDDPEDCELDDEELDSCGGNGDSLPLDPPEDDGDGVDDWLPPELDSDGGNGDC